jgi:flagellar hook-associated protein FlgK
MMAHFAENETLATSCNALLVKSTLIYQEIGELYQSMQNELSNTTVLKAHATVKTLNILLEDGRTIDNLIAEQLKGLASFAESTEDLLAKRDELLNKLYNDNINIVGRAENVKSLLRHEITTMSTNRNAMKGYKPVDTDRKSIVRNFF